MTDKLYRWAKYTDRPDIPGRYAVRMRHENDVQDEPYTEDFIELNKKLEWEYLAGWTIMEVLVPLPLNADVEQAAKEYADYEVGEKPDIDANLDPDFIESFTKQWETTKAAFIAGAGYGNNADSQMKRLYDWIMDENRKPAITVFTSSTLRHVAREIEFRIGKGGEGIAIDIEGGFKDGDIVFAPKKKQETQPSIFVYDSRIDYSSYYEGRFFRIKDSRPSRPSIDIVKQLREANPNAADSMMGDYEQGAANKAWNECCDMLATLLKQNKSK